MKATYHLNFGPYKCTQEFSVTKKTPSRTTLSHFTLNPCNFLSIDFQSISPLFYHLLDIQLQLSISYIHLYHIFSAIILCCKAPSAPYHLLQRFPFNQCSKVTQQTRYSCPFQPSHQGLKVVLSSFDLLWMT